MIATLRKIMRSWFGLGRRGAQKKGRLGFDDEQGGSAGVHAPLPIVPPTLVGAGALEPPF